jgi:uncharacterized protein YecT (DUF1311 family)
MAMNARKVGALLLGSAGCALAAAAPGPSFDCARASGEVEQLLCSDPSLARLDRQLAAVYRAATAKARGRPAALLRAEQRGWVKGRNDCWKASGQPTWITASWSVSTVPACVEAQTRLRSSELQAVWRLLPPKTLRYACQGNPANEVVASFFASDPATVRLERGDRSKTLWQVGPPDERRYEGQNVGLVLQGEALRLSWLDTTSGQTDELDCRPR